MSALQELKKHTKVVADTGDIASIKQYMPVDATTNPSLILQAVKQSNQKDKAFLEAVEYGKKSGSTIEQKIEKTIDKLTVNYGIQILNIIEGRISTEVDARLSFDTEATLQKVHDIIELYTQAGIDKSRVLIKIAATWEGIKAAEILERQGIHCNLTLLFSLGQAVACAQSKVTLISPFVGRIHDWYKKKDNLTTDYLPHEDPGVLSVKCIYNHYKKFDFSTEIMGASFRNVKQILALSGCDLLTISPKLLSELEASNQEVTCQLTKQNALQQTNLAEISIDKKNFRWLLNEDPMATEKLAEGIRLFATDTKKLETILNTII